jgi:hypothetical protein
VQIDHVLVVRLCFPEAAGFTPPTYAAGLPVSGTAVHGVLPGDCLGMRKVFGTYRGRELVLPLGVALQHQVVQRFSDVESRLRTLPIQEGNGADSRCSNGWLFHAAIHQYPAVLSRIQGAAR